MTPFDPNFAETVLGWVQSTTELEAWSAINADSLTDTAVFARWHADPDVQPYLFWQDKTLIAYGELWQENSEGEIELARLIVTPRERGKRNGQRLVAALLERAEGTGFPWAYLRVRAENAPALGCYRAAGFERLNASLERQFNAGQPHEYLWMRHALKAIAPRN